jgi:hypothetical protein
MLAQLLALAMQGFSAYREARDKALAAGDVRAGDAAVKTDAELTELFRVDAVHFRDHAQQLLDKWNTVVPPAVPGLPLDPPPVKAGG